MQKILFIVKTKNEASSRFRVFSYFDYLQNDFHLSTFYAEYQNRKLPKFFVRIYRQLRFLGKILSAWKYDIIYMQRPMTSDSSNSTLFEKLLSKVNKNIIFDYDDALYVINEIKMKSLVSIAKTCVCGNQELANFALQYNPNTFIIPTPVDTEKFLPDTKVKNTLTIGWTGTSSNYQFFTKRMIQDIKHVLEKYSHVNFLFICNQKPDANIDFDYDFIPWSAETEVDDLRKIDIGLMPLTDSPWSRGKCGFKLIQYGAIGIASIGSDVGVNNQVILDTKSGFLVKDDDWRTPLIRLIEDHELRKYFGIEARKHMLHDYSVSENYPKLKEVIQKTIQN